MSRPRLIILLLAFGTLVVFLPVGGFGFVNYDDPDYVSENSVIKSGLTLAGLRWAFTVFHAANWHPLTWLSHMADVSLFGLNAGAMHYVNALLHTLNTVLLFQLLLRLTDKIWPAAFVAALFAWHPLHVESVAWIAERKDMLSTCFALLSLLSYTAFVRQRRARDYGLTLLCFALSLLAKPMFVTLPCVMLLLDFWPLQRLTANAALLERKNLRRCVVEKIPFFLLVVPACVVTSLAQRDAMASLQAVALSLRLENAVIAYAAYLLKIFWPENLAFFYPLAAPTSLKFIGAIALLLAISILAWRGRWTHPYLAVGWLWFLGTLVPVIGLVQVGEQAMADRYTYFPAIGIFIIVAHGGAAMVGRFKSLKPAAVAAAALALIACIIATERQLRHWRTDETLFAHAVAVTRDNEIAHLNLGVVFEKQGRFSEALEEYRRALALNPRRANTHNNIADLLDEAGRADEALAEYQAALRLDPQAASAHLNLGILLVKLGRFDEGLAEFDLAAKLKPASAQPFYQTGKALLKQGRDPEALEQFHKALELEPANEKILGYVARVLAANENAAARNGPLAVNLATRANELTGGENPVVLDALGMAFATNGDFTNAITCAQNALDLIHALRIQDDGSLAARLRLYQNHQPWRESFRATNAPGRL